MEMRGLGFLELACDMSFRDWGWQGRGDDSQPWKVAQEG